MSVKLFSQQLGDTNSELIKQYFNNQLISPVVKVDNNLGNSDFSETKINQIGNDNLSYINTNDKNNNDVVQAGNNNTFQLITYYNSDQANLNVVQNGNDNNVQVYGQNDLSKNMTIIQNTNFQSIIINNY
jgi:hypothetical protein